jgi:hypothetical protein
MTSTWRVFLSSTSKDLTAYRDASNQAITSLPHFELEQMENWGAVTMDAVNQCDDKLRSCDVYVAILGPRYGSMIPADRMPADLAHLRDPISYTELEYRRAQMWRLPRLAYLLTDDASDTEPVNEGPEGAQARDRFRALVRGDNVAYERAASPQALTARLGDDLSGWVRDRVDSDLVDRDREYRMIRWRLRNKRDTIVSGPRGVGKSAIINALVGDDPRRPWAEADPVVATAFGNRVVRVAMPVNDDTNWASDLLQWVAKQLNLLSDNPWSAEEEEKMLRDPATAVRRLGAGASTLFVLENLDLAVPVRTPAEERRALQRLADGPAVLAEVGTLLMEAHDQKLAGAVQRVMIQKGFVLSNPVITIGDLSVRDAVAMLIRDAPGIQYCQDDARALVRTMGGNPQALRLVGGSAVGAATPEQTREILRSLLRQPKHEALAPYRQVMTGVISQLPEAEQRLLADLAVLPCKPHSFHFDAVVALAVEDPDLGRDLAGRLREAESEAIEDHASDYLTQAIELIEEWANEADKAEVAARQAVAQQVRELYQAMSRLCAAYLLEQIPPATPGGPQTWMIPSLVAELALPEHGILPQTQEARYHRLEAWLRDQVTGRLGSSYNAWHRFEDSGWQDDVLTWLYVLPKVNEKSARRAVAGVYLDCLWWWAMYLSFPFSIRLLRLARRDQLVRNAWHGRDTFLEKLEQIESDYPKGWQQDRRDNARKWERVGRHVRTLIGELGLDEIPAGTDPNSVEARHILALLLVVQAESQRFRARHAAAGDRPQLEERALADYGAAIDLVDGDGDDWNAAFIRFERGDALSSFGRLADAEAEAAEAGRRAKKIGEDPEELDFELLANVARLEADLAWTENEPDAALEAHGRAIHYAYAFMIYPWLDAPGHPAPDGYTLKFFHEQRERCQGRLRVLARAQDPNAAREAALKVSARFRPADAPAPALSATDAPDHLLRELLPTAPDDTEHPHSLQGDHFREHALDILRRSEGHGHVIAVPESEDAQDGDDDYSEDEYSEDNDTSDPGDEY